MVKRQYRKRAMLHYRANLDDGTLLDSTFGGIPLEFTFGRWEVIPLFEEAVRGMTPGETRRIRIFPRAIIEFLCRRSPDHRFCILVAFQWFNALNARSDQQSLFKLGLFTNRWLLGGIGLAVILQLMIIYVPLFQSLFQRSLGWDDWEW